MNALPAAEQALAGKRVLVTGHTGFTGGWATLWLRQIGAEVSGFALRPETDPSLFEAIGGEQEQGNHFGDIVDFEALQGVFDAVKPELVLHLAAQPLVRRSYAEPVRTFAVNTLGTAHVLEAARLTGGVRGVVCVTTDKVYKNREWEWAYREADELGGNDPYSASKAAAEIVIASFAKSFGKADGAAAIASARGGNIIGGGDWSADRLVPDFVRAVVNRTGMTLRYPQATRPWQHVLALVHGYILLLAGLVSEAPQSVARAWNLGPLEIEQFPVGKVLELLSAAWERPALQFMDLPLPEAGALALDSSSAFNLLGWRPAWDTRKSIEMTAEWYRQYYLDTRSARAVTLAQIEQWRSEVNDR